MDGGKGINRSVKTSGASRLDGIKEYMRLLSRRMERVRVCCGDWRRVITPGVLSKGSTIGIFLDPPYSVTDRDTDIYGEYDSLTVAHDVRDWAVENGENPRLRIALCGYEGEHKMPDNWNCFAWSAQGGYSNFRKDKINTNRHRERIWFSPHCLKCNSNLFDGL